MVQGWGADARLLRLLRRRLPQRGLPLPTSALAVPAVPPCQSILKITPAARQPDPVWGPLEHHLRRVRSCAPPCLLLHVGDPETVVALWHTLRPEVTHLGTRAEGPAEDGGAAGLGALSPWSIWGERRPETVPAMPVG